MKLFRNLAQKLKTKAGNIKATKFSGRIVSIEDSPPDKELKKAKAVIEEDDTDRPLFI